MNLTEWKQLMNLSGTAINIDDIPGEIDVAPVRHGKWTRENNYGIWKCSECGCKINRRYPLKGNIWNYYYCPNCGAKMDEGGGNETD